VHRADELPGPATPPKLGETPFQYAAGGHDGNWFPTEVFELEAIEGNRYAKAGIKLKRDLGQKLDAVDMAYLRQPFTPDSMLAWFCLRLVMYGLHNIQYSLEECWGDDPTRVIPFCKMLMTLAHYQAHSRYIHFEDSEKEEQLKFPDGKNAPRVDLEWKTRRIRDLLLTRNQQLYNLFQDLVIDEKVRHPRPPPSTPPTHPPKNYHTPLVKPTSATHTVKKSETGFGAGSNRARTKAFYGNACATV
jgi:hypothetical protein